MPPFYDERMSMPDFLRYLLAGKFPKEEVALTRRQFDALVHEYVLTMEMTPFVCKTDLGTVFCDAREVKERCNFYLFGRLISTPLKQEEEACIPSK